MNLTELSPFTLAARAWRRHRDMAGMDVCDYAHKLKQLQEAAIDELNAQIEREEFERRAGNWPTRSEEY